ncbi:MAG: carbohydrate kinase family protein [Patescibacteria group bacterium]|jgi:sugar/nucleoside kinase (ribokinase family)
MVYDFISIGGATRDISFFTDQGILIENPRDILRQKLLAFEYGAKIRIDNFNYTYGGGAANAAVNFANFKFKAACLLAIGDDDNGKAIIKNLQVRGVYKNLVKKLPGENSGFSFILISKTGERIIFTERGANKFLKLDAKDLKLLKNTKNIYISSLSGDWLSILKKVFPLAKKYGIKIAWNPSEAQYSAGLDKLAPFLKNTFVFLVNKDEAIELALASSGSGGQKLGHAFFNDENNLLKIIKEFGPQIVVITSGSQGAYAYDGLNFYYQPIFKEKKRVDITGVGDIFNSTFVAGLEIYKGNIKKSLFLSARNTASKIAHLGAQNGLIRIKL